MALDMFGPHDPLGIVFEEMGSQTGYVSPMLAVYGADGVGQKKVGTLDLQLTQDMTDEEKYRQTAEIGSFAATLEPYFTRLDEVYLVTKSSLYLPSLELTMETVFIVSHVDVAASTFTSKLFKPMYEGTEMMGVRCVATEVEPYGIDPTHSYKLLKTFLSRYQEAKPRKHSQ